jgi:uncharacterized protein YndB with AHSA1/START domain
MPSAEKSIIINASPENIWELARDPAHWHSWFEGAAEAKSIQGDGGVGTVVESSMTVANFSLPAQITVVETDPGVRWKGEFTGPATKGYQLWTYEKVDEGTRLTFKIEATLSGPAKLAEGLITRNFEQMAEQTLANIKAMSEG